MVALDAATGEEVWRAELPESVGSRGADGAGYSSAVVSHGAGVKQYVQLLGRGAVGVDAATGDVLWTYNRIANEVANIPTPMVSGDLVAVSSGYGTGTALLRLAPGEQPGEVVATEEWFLPGGVAQNHHGNMILHEGFFYFGTPHNKGFPIAVEVASGEVAWGPVRNGGTGSAAMAFADEHLLFRYQDGLVVWAEATPEGYREKGSFAVPGATPPTWAHPVIAGGRLYLREQDVLHCYDLREPALEATGTP